MKNPKKPAHGSIQSSETDLKYERSCGVFLFNQKGEVLLLQQLAGHWAFPKGHVEGSETYRECALRELNEETGLDAQILSEQMWKSYYSPSPNIQKEVLYFLAYCDTRTATPIALQAEEIQGALWLPLPQALEQLTHPENRGLLESAYPAFLEISAQKNLPIITP